jgi:FkbM family methyltransferase
MPRSRRGRQRFAGVGLLFLLTLAAPACRPSAAPRRALPAHVDLATLEQSYGQPLYSQDDEETLIRAFFQDRRGGFFLDVGAGDPIHHSTTYFLEKHLGWTGLAIDAVAEYAQAYAGKRPGTRFFSYFVSDHGDAAHDFFVSEDRNFSSGSGTDPRGGAFEKRKVTTIALNDLLGREKVTRVDFLSMDIEGAEPAALAGLDLGRYRPELACIEVGSPEIGRAVAERFALAGCREVSAYRAIDGINRYYTCR